MREPSTCFKVLGAWVPGKVVRRFLTGHRGTGHCPGSTRKKNCTGYTTDSGLHKNLLQRFLKLANDKNSGVIPLVNNDTVKVIPIALKKGGMALKPGMQVDSRQGLIIGTTEKIDYKYIQENAKPDPEKLQDIFIKEAECYCALSLDRKVNLPLGVDDINRGQDKESLKPTSLTFLQQSRYVVCSR